MQEIHFDKVLKRKVGKNSPTSGKISLPKDMIGKYVYVVVADDEGEDE